jgi:hypothetical protein
MGLRRYYTRLPQARLDSVLVDSTAWRALEDDLDELIEEADLSAEVGGNDTLGFGGLDRAYNALYYFFDPARRAADHNEVEPTTPAGAAVWGWHAMHEAFPELHDLPPRYNTAAEVAEIAAALDTLDFEAAMAEYRPALAQLYEFANVIRENYLRDRFGILREFYAEAALRGQAVIMQTE